MDLYCERVGPGFWAEPINAFTNLAFIIAAWFIWKLVQRHNASSFSIGLLIALAVAIGIGSFLFHTYATDWARFLDRLPILLFQFVVLWVYLRQIIQLDFILALGLLIIYMIIALSGSNYPDVLNGSLMYAPAFLLLVSLGCYHYLQGKNEKLLLLGAVVIFAFSLFFRTIDMAVCPYFPIGTHFLWHLINGFLLYLLGRAVIMNLSYQ